MKILTKAYYSEEVEFSNGFEQMTLGELDTDPDDGWYLHDTNTSCADWDNCTIDLTPAAIRSGSQAFSTTSGVYIARSVTAGKKFVLEFWAYIDTNAGAEYIRVELDDAPNHTSYADITEAARDPDNGIQIRVIDVSGGALEIDLYSRLDGGVDYTTEYQSANLGDYQGKWVGIRLFFTDEIYQLYTDLGDTGKWTLLTQSTWDDTDPMGNLSNCTCYVVGLVYLDDITVYSLNTTTAEEITTVTNAYCSSSMNGGGVLNVIKRDFELANYSTYSAYPWRQVEVYHHSGSTLKQKIWEGIILQPRFNYNWIQFAGMTPLRILNEIEANYSSLLAEGEVTGVSGSVLTDSNASFTASLVNKVCTFTDDAGPTYEIDYPDGGDIYQSDRITHIAYPTLEQGGWADLADETNQWHVNHAYEDMCMILTFTVANAASTTGFEIEIITQFINSGTYATDPDLYIFRASSSAWEKVSDLNVGDLPAVYKFSDTDLATSPPTNYFNGTTLKLAIHAGAWSDAFGTNEAIHCYKASVKNYYSTLFNAGSTLYTIDAQTGTTLTFTGQDIETDGVAINDRYKVGDYLHNILESIWNTASITFVSLDYDDSTNVDATDYTSDFVGPILARFAQWDNREVWDSLGWQIKSKSSYTDTSIDLTEADINVDVKGNWINGYYLVDGRNEYRKIRFFGAGISQEGVQTTTNNSLWTKMITDTRIPTEAAAKTFVTNLLSDHSDAKKILSVEIDMDKGISNIENLDIGKTIDINLYSGTINITGGLIREIHYRQMLGGHLFARLIVEVI